MLDLKRLVVFREVVRRRSFSAAAEELNYSQPAVSHHVSRLELEIGARLLERGRPDEFALTDAGRALLAHAEVLLDRAMEAESELAAIVGTQVEVRLGAFATASATLVIEALVEVRRAWPHLPVTLVEGEAAVTLDALRGGRLDIAVVFDDPLHPLPGDDAIELRYRVEDPMLLAIPATHRLGRRPRIALADLRDEAWIEGAGEETPCSLILVAACQEAGFQPRIAVNSGNFQVVQELVAAGVGVALVPRLAIDRPPRGVVFRELRPACPFRRIGLATRRATSMTPATRAMLASLEAACARRQELPAASLPA